MKMANRQDVNISDKYRTRFQDSLAHRFGDKYEQTVLKQIYLDLRSPLRWLLMLGLYSQYHPSRGHFHTRVVDP